MTGGPTCGVDACASVCHDPGRPPGRYCAPTRCYCYGCPAAPPPVARGRPRTLDQLHADQAATIADIRATIRAANERNDR